MTDIWRAVTFSVAVLNLLIWAARFYVYETPKFLVSKGRYAEAKDVLEKIARINQKLDIQF